MTVKLPPRLQVKKGNCGASVILLEGKSFTIGVSPDVDILFEAQYVSRRHICIDQIDDVYYVRDLGSTNGSSVNGKKLGPDSVALKNGDIVELASGEVKIEFRSDGTIFLAPKGIEINRDSREVSVNNQIVKPMLSSKLFDILETLIIYQGKACSKEELASAGWPEREQGEVSDQEIEQSIRRLRKRLEPDPSDPKYLVTIRGYGYRLDNPH